MELTVQCLGAHSCTLKKKRKHPAMLLGAAFVTMAACASLGAFMPIKYVLVHLRNSLETQA